MNHVLQPPDHCPSAWKGAQLRAPPRRRSRRTSTASVVLAVHAVIGKRGLVLMGGSDSAASRVRSRGDRFEVGHGTLGEDGRDRVLVEERPCGAESKCARRNVQFVGQADELTGVSELVFWRAGCARCVRPTPRPRSGPPGRLRRSSICAFPWLEQRGRLMGTEAGRRDDDSRVAAARRKCWYVRADRARLPRAKSSRAEPRVTARAWSASSFRQRLGRSDSFAVSVMGSLVHVFVGLGRGQVPCASGDR
jgi:hypothetical protein